MYMFLGIIYSTLTKRKFVYLQTEPHTRVPSGGSWTNHLFSSWPFLRYHFRWIQHWLGWAHLWLGTPRVGHVLGWVHSGLDTPWAENILGGWAHAGPSRARVGQSLGRENLGLNASPVGQAINVGPHIGLSPPWVDWAGRFFVFKLIQFRPF